MLQGIFTGKTWKLTYINLKDEGRMRCMAFGENKEQSKVSIE